MNLQLKFPNGASIHGDQQIYKKYSMEKIKLENDFYNKHKKNSTYRIPFTSDSIIWEEEERLTLLSFDPIYALANPGSKRYGDRGSYIRLRIGEDRCEKIVGLKEYSGPSGTKLYWESIPN